MKDLVTIGKRIKQKRKDMGYTQEVMSSNIGVTSQYISMIENGKAHLSDKVMDNICSFLECDISEIEGDATITSEFYQSNEFNKTFRQLNAESKLATLEFMKMLLRNQS